MLYTTWRDENGLLGTAATYEDRYNEVRTTYSCMYYLTCESCFLKLIF